MFASSSVSALTSSVSNAAGRRTLARLVLLLALAGCGTAANRDGEAPGPPLWKVTSGDHVLWIVPNLGAMPEDLRWESRRLLGVLDESRQLLLPPYMISRSAPGLVLNPLNIFRDEDVPERLTRNPSGATLQQALPPELYARFVALQQQYAPGDAEDFAELRPVAAGTALASRVLEAHELTDDDGLLSRMQALLIISRQRNNIDGQGIRLTPVIVDVDYMSEFTSAENQAETLMDSLDPAREIACLDSLLTQLDAGHIEAMKMRALGWSRGSVAGFRNVPLLGDAADPCSNLHIGTTEEATLVEALARVDQLWLDTAEEALARNPVTLAILPIEGLVSEAGVLSRLRAKGYVVTEPAAPSTP